MTFLIILLVLGAVSLVLFISAVLLSVFFSLFGDDGGKEERQMFHDMQETDYMLDVMHRDSGIDARQVHFHNHY